MEQSPKQHFSSAVDHAQEYVETQKEIIKLHFAKHSGSVAGYMAALLLIVLFFMVFYVLGNVALAFCINKQLNDLAWSFLIVAIINMLLAVLLVLMRKTIIKPIQNKIIKLITE